MSEPGSDQVTDERLLAGVLDYLPVGIWIARVPGGELVLSNRVFRDILGVEAKGDQRAGDYAVPYGICTRDGQPYPEDRLPFVRAIAAGHLITVDDIVIHRPDGVRVPVRAHARPIFDDAGVITHVVIAFTDITAERAAEALRHDTESRLREAQRLESLGNLASGVAHDVNNAMASIRILASMLRAREPDAGKAEDLRRIEDTTERTAELTRSLLTFGRHQRSAGMGPPALVDAARVAQSVVDLTRRTFDRSIAIELAANGPAWIACEAGQLDQVVMNLLVNARDAMPGGGTISVRVDPVGDDVVLEVSDTGPGVPTDLRTRIFEPYFTTKRIGDRPGTGLGLATVYGVVQQLGGTIAVTDAEPRGARFTITLPASAGQSDQAAPALPGLRRGAGRILVVDDDDQVRRATAGLLEMLGYQVVEADDGAVAIERLRGDDGFDAILLDVVMPRMGGRAALPALRALRDVPVVVTTGLATREDDVEWRALGATALLVKPYDLGELSHVLASAIGKQRLR